MPLYRVRFYRPSKRCQGGIVEVLVKHVYEASAAEAEQEARKRLNGQVKRLRVDISREEVPPASPQRQKGVPI